MASKNPNVGNRNKGDTVRISFQLVDPSHAKIFVWKGNRKHEINAIVFSEKGMTEINRINAHREAHLEEVLQ